jgi:hypothetical protein
MTDMPSGFSLEKFKSKRAREAAKPAKAKREPRKPFKAEWVRFPLSWREALRQAKSAGTTYDLALAILSEEFKQKRVGREIVLSAEVTRMPRHIRRRATKELVKLGLIELYREGGNQAYRVSIII